MYPKRGTEKEICIASSFRRNRRSVSPKGNFNKRVLVWYCRECAFLFILSMFVAARNGTAIKVFFKRDLFVYLVYVPPILLLQPLSNDPRLIQCIYR